MFNKSIQSSSNPSDKKGLRETLYGTKYASLPLTSNNRTHKKNPQSHGGEGMLSSDFVTDEDAAIKAPYKAVGPANTVRGMKKDESAPQL